MIAANIDFAVVQTSCNDDFNPRRLERTLALLWESGAQPVLLLNKCDLLDDPEELVSEAEALAPGVPVIAVSALRKLGIDALERFLRPGRTTVLLGSSGVGKSTLVNTLVGQDVLAVAAIREGDSRGRHTTSHRELVTLPGGALLIDTPGMRELALWDCEEGLTATFPEIEELGKHCRFVDCRHRDEPGCAITAALEDGTLSAERFASYQKLQRELTYLAKRQDKKAQSEQRRVNRRFAKAMRRRNRHD